MVSNRTFSCRTNAGNIERSWVASQNAFLMEGQCYAGSINDLRLLTCRVRTPVKAFRQFLFSAIAYLSSALFIYFVFLLGFSFINDKSFTFFRQKRTCALRIPIPAPARNPFSSPFPPIAGQ